MENVSLSTEEAITKVNAELNLEMVNFGRWVAQNPSQTVSTNMEFRQMKQNIKLLRLRVRELEEMRDSYRNILRFTSPDVGNGLLLSSDQNPNVKEQVFSKPRTVLPTENIRPSNKLGSKGQTRVSKG